MLHPLRAAARFIDQKIGWNRIGPDGGLALAKSAHLKSLRLLSLNDNPLREHRRAVSALRARFGGAVNF